MDVQEDGGMRAGCPLKLNSCDLGVDLELADAIQRIRFFEHPEVVLVFGSAKDRIFCSGREHLHARQLDARVPK